MLLRIATFIKNHRIPALFIYVIVVFLAGIPIFSRLFPDMSDSTLGMLLLSLAGIIAWAVNNFFYRHYGIDAIGWEKKDWNG